MVPVPLKSTTVHFHQSLNILKRDLKLIGIVLKISKAKKEMDKMRILSKTTKKATATVLIRMFSISNSLCSLFSNDLEVLYRSINE